MVPRLFAQGATRISGIESLRTKESDRVAAIERLLTAVGIATELRGNDISIAGGVPAAAPDAHVATAGDHRIAMAAAMLARAVGPIAIDDLRSADVSFPGFAAALESFRI